MRSDHGCRQKLHANQRSQQKQQRPLVDSVQQRTGSSSKRVIHKKIVVMLLIHRPWEWGDDDMVNP